MSFAGEAQKEDVGKTHKEMEKENGVIHLQVKECQGLVKERDSLIFYNVFRNWTLTLITCFLPPEI